MQTASRALKSEGKNNKPKWKAPLEVVDSCLSATPPTHPQHYYSYLTDKKRKGKGEGELEGEEGDSYF